MAFLTASLVLFLLGFSSKVVAEGQRIITAEPGDNVILTCRAAENKDVIVVKWSKADLESDQYVLVYRGSQFDPEGQSPSFRNRVDLLDVKNGDVSLVLKNVTTDDTGTYECRVVQEGNNQPTIKNTKPISTIPLRVEAGNKEGGNKDGLKEDGGNKTGLIVGILVGILALVSLIGFLLYRNRGHLCQEQKPSPAAGLELEPMNPENRPPAEE